MKGTSVAFLSVFCFSLYPIFAKVLLETTSPFMLIVIRQITAGLLIVAALVLTRKYLQFKVFKKHEYVMIFVIGALVSAAGPILFIIGLSQSTATNSVLLGKSEALMTSVLAIMLLKEKVSSKQLIGALLMSVGIILIATRGFAEGFIFSRGDLLILLSALFYSFGNVAVKRFFSHHPPELLVALRNLSGASVLFTLSFFILGPNTVSSFVSKPSLPILLTMVLTVTLGQYLWYLALELTTATNVSLINLSSPIMSVFYAAIFLGETLFEYQILGGIFIVIGMMVFEFHLSSFLPNHVHRHHLIVKPKA